MLFARRSLLLAHRLHFAAMRNLVGYRGIADIDQAAPIKLDL
jgi:hypothetical protein